MTGQQNNHHRRMVLSNSSVSNSVCGGGDSASVVLWLIADEDALVVILRDHMTPGLSSVTSVIRLKVVEGHLGLNEKRCPIITLPTLRPIDLRRLWPGKYSQQCVFIVFKSVSTYYQPIKCGKKLREGSSIIYFMDDKPRHQHEKLWKWVIFRSFLDWNIHWKLNFGMCSKTRLTTEWICDTHSGYSRGGKGEWARDLM